MKTRELFESIIRQINLDESADEVAAIAYFVLDKVCGFTKAAILANREIASVPDLTEIISRINRHEPVQYVIGEADFFGRSFKVDANVLIPRPETEQLVSIALGYLRPGQSVLDIGTGSGCISITLALESPLRVWATDISEKALALAQYNSNRLKANVSFFKHDILNQNIPTELIDIVISNPPYVTEKEKRAMKKNVVDHEPHGALFVPDTDPLIFYEAIAKRSKNALQKKGKVIVEINEHLGIATSEVFKKHGFGTTDIMKDINNKDRFVIAQR